MSEEPKSDLLVGRDKALLIALATPFAYVLAFQYDRGYLNYFGVPDVLVDVSLRDLLIAVVTLVSIAWSVYLVLDGVLTILPDGWPLRLRRRAMQCFWVTIAIVVVNNIFNLPGSVFAIGIGLIALLFFLSVVLPILRKSSAGLDAKNPVAPLPDPYAHKGVIPALMRRGVDRRMVIVISIALAAGYVANITGAAKAISQTSFLVYIFGGDGIDCVVIRMRDSDFLCADFDPDAHKMLGNYRFVKSEGSKVSLQQTGRLKPPDAAREPVGSTPQSAPAKMTTKPS
jgi:hypothetical protein